MFAEYPFLAPVGKLQYRIQRDLAQDQLLRRAGLFGRGEPTVAKVARGLQVPGHLGEHILLLILDILNADQIEIFAMETMALSGAPAAPDAADSLRQPAALGGELFQRDFVSQLKCSDVIHVCHPFQNPQLRRSRGALRPWLDLPFLPTRVWWGSSDGALEAASLGSKIMTPFSAPLGGFCSRTRPLCRSGRDGVRLMAAQLCG